MSSYRSWAEKLANCAHLADTSARSHETSGAERGTSFRSPPMLGCSPIANAGDRNGCRQSQEHGRSVSWSFQTFTFRFARRSETLRYCEIVHIDRKRFQPPGASIAPATELDLSDDKHRPPKIAHWPPTKPIGGFSRGCVSRIGEESQLSRSRLRNEPRRGPLCCGPGIGFRPRGNRARQAFADILHTCRWARR